MLALAIVGGIFIAATWILILAICASSNTRTGR